MLDRVKIGFSEKAKDFYKLYKEIVLLFISIIAGSIVGNYFQNKFWKLRYQEELKRVERSSATKVFEEISRLMDKRFYRMQLLYWAAEDRSSKVYKKRLRDYRNTLFLWNDNLNRNLALVERYFGKKMRKEFENNITNRFVKIGQDLELYLKTGDMKHREKLKAEFDTLKNHIYEFNIKMIKKIQTGQVGIFQLEQK